MRTDCKLEENEKKESEVNNEGDKNKSEGDSHKRFKRGPLTTGRNRRGFQAAYLFAR